MGINEEGPSFGPYTLDEEALNGVGGCRSILDVEGEQIAYTAGLSDDQMDLANAYLFAASWEMLHVLTVTLNQLRQTGIVTGEMQFKINNVIKKAYNKE